MANLNEADDWPAGIYQIEEDDPVLGGPSGITNTPPSQLAARTRYQRLRSVAPWVAALPYPAQVAYVGHAGASWKSVAASTGVEPGTDPEKWVRWGFTLEELNASLGVAVAAHEAKPNPHPQYANNAARYGADTGPANACAVAYTPAIAALVDGMELWFEAAASNTGAATLKVNDLAAKPIVGGAQAALQGSEILAGGKCLVVWSDDLNAFVLIGCTGAASQVANAVSGRHALPLGQANQIFGGTVTNIAAAGATALTSLNAGLVLVNATAGSITITLPVTGAQNGLPFLFVRIDSTPGNLVTINRASTDTIDGFLTSFPLVGQFDRRHIKSNGVGTWYTASANFSSRCSAYQSAAQTAIASGTFTKVNLQTKSIDAGGEFNASRFTAKEAGLYQINGGINIAAPSAGYGYFCALFMNGSMMARGASVVGYANAVQSCSVVSDAISLAAGDYIELYAYGDTSFSLVNGPSATRLSIARIQ